MPIPVILQPPPAFDRSIVPAFQTNFNRIRDALLKAFGGNYQTGVHVQPAIGTNLQHFNISYPTPFTTPSAPIVVANPNCVGNQWKVSVGIVTNGFFAAYCELLGASATENLTIQWVAWYP